MLLSHQVISEEVVRFTDVPEQGQVHNLHRQARKDKVVRFTDVPEQESAKYYLLNQLMGQLIL